MQSQYKALLLIFSNDVRKAWIVLSCVIARKHDVTDGRKVTDQDVIVNGFEKYFSNIGRRFAEVIPPI